MKGLKRTVLLVLVYPTISFLGGDHKFIIPKSSVHECIHERARQVGTRRINSSCCSYIPTPTKAVSTSFIMVNTLHKKELTGGFEVGFVDFLQTPSFLRPNFLPKGPKVRT